MSSLRMQRYAPVARELCSRIALLHDAVAKLLGVHSTALKVLRLVAEEPIAPSQLVEHTGLTGATVTAVVDRLVAAGYAVRTRSAGDLRRVSVRAVPRGVREMDRLYEACRADISRLLDHLEAREFEAVENFLQKATHIVTEHTAKLRKGGGSRA